MMMVLRNTEIYTTQSGPRPPSGLLGPLNLCRLAPLLWALGVIYNGSPRNKIGYWGSLDWTDLAQDREKWRALVNIALKLRVP
jgi:hypothetical protein